MRPAPADQPLLGAGGRADGAGTVGGASARGEVAGAGVEPGELAEVELADGELADGELAEVELAEVELAEVELADGELADGELADGPAVEPEVTVFPPTRAATASLAACALSLASSRPRAASRFTSGLSASSVTWWPSCTTCCRPPGRPST
jgi:hypothetical protein